MRLLSLSVSLVSLVPILAACHNPTSAEVCKRFDELDKQKPMPRYGEHELSNRPRASKFDGCVRGMNELNRNDPHSFRSAARCIEKATNSSDSWNCYVLDHLSKNQPEEKTKLVSCNARADRARLACEAPCTDDHCRAGCAAAYEDALVECQFR